MSNNPSWVDIVKRSEKKVYVHPREYIEDIMTLHRTQSSSKIVLSFEMYHNIMNWYGTEWDANVDPSLIGFSSIPFWNNIRISEIDRDTFFYLYEMIQTIVFGEYQYWDFSFEAETTWESLLNKEVVIKRPRNKDKVFVSVKNLSHLLPPFIRCVVECDPMVNFEKMVQSNSQLKLSEILTVYGTVSLRRKRKRKTKIGIVFERFDIHTTEKFLVYWALLIQKQPEKYK